MKKSSITLKQYIISNNYRKQVQNSNKKYIQQHNSTICNGTNSSTAQKFTRSRYPGKNIFRIKLKAEQLKKIVRKIVTSDIDFITIEKKIEEMKQLCTKEIEKQRDNQQLLKSIIQVEQIKSSFNSTQNQFNNKNPNNQRASLQQNFQQLLQKSITIDNRIHNNKKNQNYQQQKLSNSNLCDTINFEQIKGPFQQIKNSYTERIPKEKVFNKICLNKNSSKQNYENIYPICFARKNTISQYCKYNQLNKLNNQKNNQNKIKQFKR